jgi:hypothetical protein
VEIFVVVGLARYGRFWGNACSTTNDAGAMAPASPSCDNDSLLAARGLLASAALLRASLFSGLTLCGLLLCSCHGNLQ